MATGPTNVVLKHVRNLLGETKLRQLTDRQLLDRYVGQRDEAAFAKLVERHGPLVLRVCQRILHEPHSAEDAFQATFFVLARKAKAVAKRKGLGPWLYGVASRIALHARVDRAKRRRREMLCEPRCPADPLTEVTGRELCAVLEEELNRLPERYRTPFRFCYLEGQTRDQVAQQLGWSLRTLHRRLEQGRKILHASLTRRGVTLAAALVASDLIPRGSAATMPAFLAMATAKAALYFAGSASGGNPSLSTTAVTLAQSALQGMAFAKMNVVGVMVLAFTLGTTGLGLLVHHASTHELGTPTLQPQPTSTQPAIAAAEPAEKRAGRVDLLGDPLPAGALARLGSSRWRLDVSGADVMVCSSDGKTLVTANTTTGITFWDMATGKTVRQLPSEEQRKEWLHKNSVIALAADGKTAALSGQDGNVHWLDLQTGQEARSIPASPQEIALSADGRVLAIRANFLQVWERDSGKRVWETPFNFKLGGVADRKELALSPDGKTIACVDDSPERVIRMFDVASGAEKQQLGKCKGPNRHLVFSPDSQKLLAADAGNVQLWDVNGGQILHTWEHKHFGGLTPAAFAPDGKSVVFLREDMTIRRVDTLTGQELGRLPVIEVSSKLGLFAFTPDGQTLVHFSGARPVLCRYDLASGKPITSPGELPSIEASAFAADERILYTLSRDKKLRAWEADTGKEVRQTEVASSWGTFSPDGRTLAVFNDGTIALYETATGKQRWQADVDGKPWYRVSAFSPSGDRFVATGDGGTVVLWDVATGQELHRLVKPGLPWRTLQLAADGKSIVGLVTGGAAKKSPTVYTLDLPTGRETARFSLPPDAYLADYSVQGKNLFVSRQSPSALECYDMTTGKQPLEKISVSRWPTTARFSPQGDLLLVADDAATVRFFDVYTGLMFQQREVHRASVLNFVFTPSGRRLATLSADHTGLVWNTQGFLWPDKTPSTELTRMDLDSLWTDLADADAAKVYEAMGRLISIPDQTIRLLRERVKPAVALDANRLEKLLGDLNSVQFLVRQQATDAIAELGELAQPALEKHLAQAPSLEVRQRVEKLLGRLDSSQSPECRQRLRAVRVLEYLGTPEAEQLLRHLARGVPEARLTQEAKAALDRLARASR